MKSLEEICQVFIVNKLTQTLEERKHKVSISPTVYEQLLRQNPFANKLKTQIVST
jgi:hypothetical protein